MARETDSGLGEIDLRGLDPGGAEAICDRIGTTGAPTRVRRLARDRVEAAKRTLAAAPLSGEERELLALVADGVVDRYS